MCLRISYRQLFGTLLTTLALFAFEAGADNSGVEKVEFESVSFIYKPSPFRIKQAKKNGTAVVIKTEPSVTLLGYLVKPANRAPKAAIVLLHTCAGISEHEHMWSTRLVSWGYLVLLVDSFAPRNIDYLCDGRIGNVATSLNRALDAYGAQHYLTENLEFAPSEIGVIGLSHGGTAVLETIKASITDDANLYPFGAAAAFYPLCGAGQELNTKTLILTGEKDSWTPATLCEEFASSSRPANYVTLNIYPEAHHAFDHPNIDTIDAEYIVRSHPQMAKKANHRLREFLSENL